MFLLQVLKPWAFPPCSPCSRWFSQTIKFVLINVQKNLKWALTPRSFCQSPSQAQNVVSWLLNGNNRKLEKGLTHFGGTSWYLWVHAQWLSCVRLWKPMDCSLLGSPVHGIFQTRILEWVAISYFKISPHYRASKGFVFFFRMENPSLEVLGKIMGHFWKEKL